MNRSVCKFGLAAALVLTVLAFRATPAQARVYVSGYYAPTPACSCYHPPRYYRGVYVGWRRGWHGRGWRGRYRGVYVGWRRGWYGRGWHGRGWRGRSRWR
jgi:hypothetical protein